MNLTKTVLCLCFCIPYVAVGQSLPDIIKNSMKRFEKDKISYNYKLALVNSKSNTEIDAVKGKMFRHNNYYLDSNSYYLNIRDVAYGLQIDRKRKVGYLKSVKQMEGKLRKKLDATPNVLFDINNLLEKGIASSKTTTNAAGQNILTIKFKDPQLRELVITMSGDHEVIKLTVKMAADTEGDAEFLRVLTMENFMDDFPPGLVSTNRFLGSANKTLALKGSYTGYKLRHLSY
jgi:hypothetical protein